MNLSYVYSIVGTSSLADLCTQQLVIDKSVASLPRRKTDGAIIIRSQDDGDAKARIFKLNAVFKDPILIERCVTLFEPASSSELWLLDKDAMNDSIVFIVHAVACQLHTRQPHLP